MKSGRRDALIVVLAVVVGIVTWVGGSAIRYGSLGAGLVHIVLDSPALAPLISRKSSNTLAGHVAVLAIGDHRPDLALADTTGAMRRLSEWDGKHLVLNFWATWCVPCIKEIPLFEYLQADYAQRGLQVVGIGLDAPDKVTAWVTAHPVNYPMLLAGNLDYDLSAQFGNHINAVPYTVVIGPDGTLLRQHLGSFDNAAGLRDWVLAGRQEPLNGQSADNALP